jgi:nitroreductase
MSATAKSNLDTLLARRRSCREFASGAPDDGAIQAILQAGWLAPHAGATGVPLAEKRRFVVVRRGSPAHVALYARLMAIMKRNRRSLSFARFLVPGLRRKTETFYKRTASLAGKGIRTLETAPFWIIVAERRGFPPAQDKSLAHVMQNMWLKATDLGLGFMLLSATGTAAKDARFMDMLGLKKGEWSIDGCLVGLPALEIKPSGESLPEEAVRRL